MKKAERKQKMYLHIGNEKMVKVRELIGIFDMDTATVSPITKDYLKRKEQGGSTEMICHALPKSFTVEDSGKVKFSPISTQALIGRI